MFNLFKNFVVNKANEVRIHETAKVVVNKVETRTPRSYEESKFFTVNCKKATHERLMAIPIPKSYHKKSGVLTTDIRLSYLCDLYSNSTRLGKGNHKIRKFYTAEAK